MLSKTEEAMDYLRKFGVKYCDLPTMLSNVSAMLRVLALEVDGRKSKRIPTSYILLTVSWSILFIHTYVVSAIMFWCKYRHDKSRLPAVFVSFSLTVTSCSVVIRLYYLIFHTENIKKLTNKYLALDARIVQGSRFSTNMLKSLKNVKMRGIVYWWVLMVDAVVYIAKPLVLPGRHLGLDDYVIYGLEPMMESPNYEIATIITAICVLHVCYAVASVTCFSILTIGYNEAEMLSLSEEMVNLWADALEYFKNNIKSDTKHDKDIDKAEMDIQANIYVKKHLIEIIQRHVMTKSNLHEIDSIKRGVNALAFILLVTGLIAELLGGLENTYLQLPFTMTQLAVDCYLGQKVIDSSEAFERAVYDCKWELFNESNRKIVLVMLQNSQKTVTLSAGGMATLSFSCLMTIIKNTYSGYTSLRSTV